MAKKTGEMKLKEERRNNRKKLSENKSRILELMQRCNSLSKELADTKAKAQENVDSMDNTVALARVSAMFLQRAMHLLQQGIEPDVGPGWHLAVNELHTKYTNLCKEVYEKNKPQEDA